MRLYHASNHVVEKPNLDQHRRNLRSIINGNSVLGLFCNSSHEGLGVFGDNLYSFTLSEEATVLEIEDEFRQPGRCAEYYRGIRDLLLWMGYDAVTVKHDNCMSAVVLNFDVIEDWRHDGEAD